MSQDASEVMAPDVDLEIRGGKEKVTVRELNWKAMRAFMKLVAGRCGSFFEVDAAGNVGVDNGKVIALILADLGDDLVMATTGKDREWIDELAPVDFMALFDRAAELNLRPEMMTHAGNALGRFRPPTGAAAATSPTRTTT